MSVVLKLLCMPSAADSVAQFRMRSLLSFQRSVSVDERFLLLSLGFSKLPSFSSIVRFSKLQLDRFSTLVASEFIDDTEIDISDRSVEKLSCDGERRIRFVTARAGVVELFCDAIGCRPVPVVFCVSCYWTTLFQTALTGTVRIRFCCSVYRLPSRRNLCSVSISCKGSRMSC
uniref:Uncharacterized protein n=2 Tax=Anopheles funestus TaxID=62324 RepID=A0A182S4B4_ANOFN